MKSVRYAFVVLSVVAPSLVLAQGPDSVQVAFQGVAYPAYVALFGPRFELGENVGPLPLIAVEGDGTTSAAVPEQGCDPLVNGGEVAGNIAFVLRGNCPFTTKVQNAAAAGAVAVIVYNDDRVPPNDESLDIMNGECTAAQGCSVPAAFISRFSGLNIIGSGQLGANATIIPIRVTTPTPTPTAGRLDTGVVDTAIFDSGYIGDAPSAATAPGFRFNGEQGLFIGSLLVGRNGVVVGDPYGMTPEFVTAEPVTPVTPPAPFDIGFRTRLRTPADIGVTVTVNAFARTGDPYVFYDLTLQNFSSATIDGIYAGLFADLDIGTFNMNVGGFDAQNNVLYASDASAMSANVFGLSAVTFDTVSGYTLVTDGSATESSLWQALTTAGTAITEPQDVRAVVGLGPYDLAANSSRRLAFALLAGSDLSSVLASAQAARELYTQNVAVEATTPEGTFVLESAYPNPVASRATIGFELPTAQDVRVAVYDVLGREVAVLTEGVRQAGAQTVEFDVSSLPSGVYIYRLSAGSTQLTQTMTVVR